MSIFKSARDETTARTDERHLEQAAHEEGAAAQPTRSDVPPDEQIADPDGQAGSGNGTGDGTRDGTLSGTRDSTAGPGDRGSSLEGDLAAEGAARTEREGAQGRGEQPVEQSPPGGSGPARGDAASAAGAGAAGAAAGDTPERLVPRERADDYTSRWDRVKSGFVDEPRQAVGEADALVGELLDEMQALFAEQRRRLEHGLDSDSTSTEDLRLALRRYRSFFDRLVAF